MPRVCTLQLWKVDAADLSFQRTFEGCHLQTKN